MDTVEPESGKPVLRQDKDSVRTIFSYFIVLVLYIVLGYNFKTVFLNWIVGPLFLVITLYYIPLLTGLVFNRKETTN